MKEATINKISAGGFNPIVARFATPEQVIDHYNNGAKDHPNSDIQIPKGGYKIFADADKAAMIAFLKTLTDSHSATDEKYSDPFK